MDDPLFDGPPPSTATDHGPGEIPLITDEDVRNFVALVRFAQRPGEDMADAIERSRAFLVAAFEIEPEDASAMADAARPILVEGAPPSTVHVMTTEEMRAAVNTRVWADD